MTRRIATFVFVLLAALWGVRDAPSLAQGYGEGVLNAVAYRPMTAGGAFTVSALDNSDRSLALKKEIEDALKAKGFTVNDDAEAIVTFEIRDEIGAYTTRNKRAILELEARGGREGGENARMRFNLYDSNTGGMFNAGKGETSIVTPSQYRIDLAIDARSTGKRLWQAWAVANLGQSDGAALTHAMVPVLVEKIGQTVKSELFELF